VRIKNPAVLETRGFGLARESDNPIDCHVGFDSDTKLHAFSFAKSAGAISGSFVILCVLCGYGFSNSKR
jgi:hypothetical protein